MAEKKNFTRLQEISDKYSDKFDLSKLKISVESRKKNAVEFFSRIEDSLLVNIEEGTFDASFIDVLFGASDSLLDEVVKIEALVEKEGKRLAVAEIEKKPNSGINGKVKLKEFKNTTLAEARNIILEIKSYVDAVLVEVALAGGANVEELTTAFGPEMADRLQAKALEIQKQRFEAWAEDSENYPEFFSDIDYNLEFIEDVSDIDPRDEYDENQSYIAYFRSLKNQLDMPSFKAVITDNNLSSEQEKFLYELYVEKLTEAVAKLEERITTLEKEEFDEWAAQVKTEIPELNQIDPLMGVVLTEDLAVLKDFIAKAEKFFEDVEKKTTALDSGKTDFINEKYLLELRNKLVTARKMETDVLAKEKSFEELEKEINHKIVQAENQSRYNVDEHHNEIEEKYENIEHLIEALEKSATDKADKIKEIKERFYLVFYKLYRNNLIDKMISDENEEKSMHKWDEVYREKLIDRSHNIVEQMTGLKIANIQQYENDLKAAASRDEEIPPIEDVIADLARKQRVNLSDLEKRMLADYLNISQEYTARKFLHLTWMSNRETITGMTRDGSDNVRKYPAVNRDSNYPLMIVYEYLTSGGLKDRGFGEKRFLSLGQREAQVAGLKDGPNGKLVPTPDAETGKIKYEATLTGEAMRALDRWARGFLKLPVSTNDFHNNIGDLVTGITDYIKKRNPNFANEIKKDEVMLAVRQWIMLTFHQSARAKGSANLPDMIYYAHKIFEYNEKYSEQGRAHWNTTMIRMLYTYFRPQDGTYYNPLPIILGQHADIEAERGSLRSMFEANGFNKMKDALKAKGFFDDDLSNPKVQERLKRDHFINYQFLLGPFLEMTERAGSRKWKDKFSTTGHSKEFIAGDAGNDSELFTQSLVLDTIFLKDSAGKTLYFDKKDEDGFNIGSPISLFDVRDEYGEIIYERILTQDHSNDFAGVISSLAKNGFVFLNEILKTPDILGDLESPNKISARLNQIVYALIHLPGVGRELAAGSHLGVGEDDVFYNADKATQRQIIAQMVFVGCILRILDDQYSWSIPQVEEYLLKLVRVDSSAISEETGEAIAVALRAALGNRAMVRRITNEGKNRLKESFKHR